MTKSSLSPILLPDAPELEKLSTDSESNSVDSMMEALRAVMAPVEQL